MSKEEVDAIRKVVSQEVFPLVLEPNLLEYSRRPIKVVSQEVFPLVLELCLSITDNSVPKSYHRRFSLLYWNFGCSGHTNARRGRITGGFPSCIGTSRRLSPYLTQKGRITGGFPSCIGTRGRLFIAHNPFVVSQEVFPLVLEQLRVRQVE